MTKYHINKEGRPGVCHATKEPCPFGGSEVHFGTEKEAQDYIDKKLTEQYGYLNAHKEKATLLPRNSRRRALDNYKWAKGLSHEEIVKELDDWLIDPEGEYYLDTGQIGDYEITPGTLIEAQVRAENGDVRDVIEQLDRMTPKESGYQEYKMAVEKGTSEFAKLVGEKLDMDIVAERHCQSIDLNSFARNNLEKRGLIKNAKDMNNVFYEVDKEWVTEHYLYNNQTGHLEKVNSYDLAASGYDDKFLRGVHDFESSSGLSTTGESLAAVVNWSPEVAERISAFIDNKYNVKWRLL